MLFLFSLKNHNCYSGIVVCSLKYAYWYMNITPSMPVPSIPVSYTPVPLHFRTLPVRTPHARTLHARNLHPVSTTPVPTTPVPSKHNRTYPLRMYPTRAYPSRSSRAYSPHTCPPWTYRLGTIPRDAGVRVASLPQLRQVVRGDYGAVFYGTTTLKHRFPL